MRKKRVEPGSLWVVIPCFNEAKGLRATLDALHLLAGAMRVHWRPRGVNTAVAAVARAVIRG